MPQPNQEFSILRILLSLMMLLLCGAQLGCDEEKPYTPFQIATQLPKEESPHKTTENADEEEAQHLNPASVERQAPTDSTSWTVFDRKIEAPEGTVFQGALLVPNSESDETIAWALPSKKAPTTPNAGIWLYDKAGLRMSQLSELPSYLPRGSDCHFVSSLAQTGAASITARLLARCTTRLLPGTPNQAIVILTPGRTEQVLLHLQAQQPAPGESLSFHVDTSDRDNDGLDDVEVRISLAAPGGKKETLPLRWLSRAAGASRQAASPGKELSARASRLITASIRKAERKEVPLQVDTLRRLLAAICEERATPKIARQGDRSFNCGDIQTALVRLTHAKAQAYLGEKQYDLALGEVERVDWYAKKPTDKQKKGLAQLILKRVPHFRARKLARFNVEAQSLSQPYASPLHFDATGQLWALLKEGKTKRLTMKGDPPLVTAATEDSPEIRVDVPDWSLLPEGPGGRSLSAALPSCNRSEVQLTFNKSVGSPAPPIPVPLLAPRPGICRTLAPLPLGAIPLEWDAGQLLLVLGGQLVTTGGHLRPRKAPIAWGTRLGVAIKQGSELHLLTGDVTHNLHHCVSNKSASKVACVTQKAVVVLAPEGTESQLH